MSSPAEVVAWLHSPQGRKWSQRHFDNVNIYREIIEIIDDYASDQIADHTWRSDRWMLGIMAQVDPVWAVEWTPDTPP